MTNFKRFSGIVPFYEFDLNEVFIGYFTGRYHKVGDKECPVFCDEDGEEWLMNTHTLIMEFCKEVGPDKLMKMKYRGKIKMKSGKSISNYTIEVEDEKKETTKEQTPAAIEEETQTAKEAATDPRSKAVLQSGKNRNRK